MTDSGVSGEGTQSAEACPLDNPATDNATSQLLVIWSRTYPTARVCSRCFRTGFNLCASSPTARGRRLTRETSENGSVIPRPKGKAHYEHAAQSCGAVSSRGSVL